MFRTRFFWQISGSLLILSCTVAAVVTILFFKIVEKESLEEVRELLRSRTLLLQSLINSREYSFSNPLFHKELQNLGTKIKTRLTVIQPDGTVLADSAEDISSIGNLGSRPEILAVQSHGFGSSIQYSDTFKKSIMYFALPIYSGERHLGYVRTALSLSIPDQRLSDLRFIVFFLTSLIIITGIGSGILFIHYSTKPLIQMKSLAEGILNGNYDRPLPTTRNDEFGKLARALKNMAQHSQDRMESVLTDRNKLLLLLKSMVEGVVAIDNNERVLQMNSAAGKILGASSETSLSKPIWEVTRVSKACEILSTALETKAEVKRKLSLTTHAKDQVVEMTAAPLLDREETLVGAVLVLHDLTALHRLETIRRDFVSNASHELKTPITVVRAIVETLIEDKDIPLDQQQKFLMKIHAQSLRLSAVVDDLMTISRLESDSGMWDRKPLDLRSVVQQSTQLFLPLAEERKVNLEIQVEESPVIVMGDEKALGQITDNLLDNALKYTAQNGTVVIRLTKKDKKAILEVQDSGVGISAKDRSRIFERFYRVDTARSRELGGTGLGLSIVKHITESHRGQIFLDSTPGIGSTFRVSLPIRL